ncbi:MAG TPA: signal recognition particle protein [Myxococcota bacterium]|nr:signal recognition particle protein [Myxococcota bacterium]HRY93839.1 signal recognition particle protein [Myxococcota bacterium]
MFEGLSDKLGQTFKRLKGHGKLSEANIKDALREVRLSLLEADVNFQVVKDFVTVVKDRAMGQEVLASLTPGQQFIKVVYEELVKTMGGQAAQLDLKGRPPVAIMLCGLQGSGKTTSVAKLSLHLKKLGRRPYLVPADVYRPAAIDQLTKLGADLGLPVHPSTTKQDPVAICREAMEAAERAGHDVVLLDTAGRLHVDQELMNELLQIKREVQPRQILLVADAMTGQDAVQVAEKFNSDLGIDGLVLTKLDGDARGGAALSIKAVTGKPLMFVGTGEKMDALDIFYPDRMASRILGMGDMLGLIEKAQESYDKEKAEELQRKFKKNEFTIEDFREHLKQLRKMGSISDLMEKIPGMGNMMKKMPGAAPPEDELKRIEAIINSMTKLERVNHAILNASRRRRIAKGSGTTVQDVNQFVKQYLEMKKMMKKINKFGMKTLLRSLMGGKM